MTEPSYVDFDQPARDLFQAWRYAKEAVDYWEAEEARLGKELMDYMGERTRGTIDGQHVVTKVPPGTVNQFNVARFHDAMPDIYAQFIVPSDRRGHLRMARSPSRQSR